MTQPPPSHAGSYHCADGDDTFLITLHEPPGDALKKVPETLVQDLWQMQRFDATDLQATDGTSIRVLDPGTPNHDAGPDFTGARLRIGDMRWDGAVEVHVTSSGWFEHEHHTDARYNNVVLHVVLHADMWTGGLLREDESTLPELVLFPHLTMPLRQLLHAHYTRSSDDDILCAPQWSTVPDTLKTTHMTELGRERLTAKKKRLAHQAEETPNLAELLHRRVFAGLGYAKNDAPMTTLAERLPLRLTDCFPDAFDLEALHFGVAGLLPTPKDLLEADRATADYAMRLRDRFRQLNARLELAPMQRTQWKFFRLRPANFPPLRIAQGVALLEPKGLLHDRPLSRLADAAMSEHPKRALRQCFEVSPSPFWDDHVRLTKTAKLRSSDLGRTRIDQLLVNAVAPVLLLHAEEQHRPALKEAVFQLLRDLPAPRDRVTRRFTDLGTRAEHALMAQGQHQLYRTHCQEARCLQCPIGQRLLNRD